MTPSKFGRLDLIVGIGVTISMLFTWFLFPQTPPPGGVNTTPALGLRYFGTFLVGFLEVLAYGGVKSSPRIVGLAIALVAVGCVLLYLS